MYLGRDLMTDDWIIWDVVSEEGYIPAPLRNIAEFDAKVKAYAFITSIKMDETMVLNVRNQMIAFCSVDVDTFNLGRLKVMFEMKDITFD